jgi:transaldolase
LHTAKAQDCCCRIITATPDLIAKVPLFGKALIQYSLETVKVFHEDARAAGFKLV